MEKKSLSYTVNSNYFYSATTFKAEDQTVYYTYNVAHSELQLDRKFLQIVCSDPTINKIVLFPASSHCARLKSKYSG